MKIVHICLAAVYVEGMGYQENILPQFHVEMGNDVTVITSRRIFNSRYEAMERQETRYTNPYGVKVITLEASTRYGFYSKYGDFDGLYDTLLDLQPDIVFVHGAQFVGLMDVIKYCKKHSPRLYIDQHADYYNTPVNTFKRKVTQKWLFGYWVRKAVPLTSKFWGVTPWRCQYLNEVYSVPKEKIGLLVMGGDDRFIDLKSKEVIRESLRAELNIAPDDFVIITGGKIDSAKNIHLLMQVVIELERKNLKLVVFGQPVAEMEETIKNLSSNTSIVNIGWIPSESVYNYYLMSDLAFFPGTHSVLWEQSCACGLPGCFKDWEGMRHVNVNGSARFLQDTTLESMKQEIAYILDNPNIYTDMKNAAEKYAVTEFSYREIAKRSITE